MYCIPAIDLKDGKCVRLYQGDFDQTTEYECDVIELCKKYESQGAKELHVVDLSGAKSGKSLQKEWVNKILQNTSLEMQVGGGIRAREDLVYYFNRGVKRVVIGSLAVSDTKTVIAWLKEFGADRITIALDVQLKSDNTPIIMTQGWQSSSALCAWDLLEQFNRSGLRHVLCTDIARDGTLSGPNQSLYKAALLRFPELLWQASGGVQALQDLEQLRLLGLTSVVIGKALFENKFSLSEALEQCQI
ncbi:MAG: 1-(5-phosphoribosyl)-5-[(5-phosphoribosylamino)methylideneamino]imidazole-4-carboxamide isomerase [Candidatus Berkiella sp.]